MNWISIYDKLPPKAGWYAAAINPRNASDLGVLGINSWRERFGFTKIWFNPAAPRKWWAPNPLGPESEPVDERVTHWAVLPSVPLIQSEVREEEPQ